MLALFNLGGGEIALLIALFVICYLAALALVSLGIFLFARSWAKKRNAAGPTTPPPPVPSTAAEATQIFPRKCPRCNAELKADAPEGLCPACLLQHGFATEGGGGLPGTASFTPPPLTELGKLFPQLEILEMIGQGGMGAVYKARQPALDRFVALKILAPRTGGDVDFSSRFSREARALARLSHPNIVAVYDFGQIQPATNVSAGSLPVTSSSAPLNYFIMEFVDGPNLRQVELAGKLSPREALQIIPQICVALQFAHDEGIVHRDIKPENVLIDKKGRVKIADFGLAKILGQEADFRLTGARDVMGTPHYMAPEQVETPQEVDHRADIYSLGVVFYEMLTGELPLGKFDPPSHKVQVDVRLDDVVMRSLSKNPERRYQHVSEVGTHVESIAQNPSMPGAQSAASAFVEQAARRDYQLKIRYCVSRGWTLMKRNFWPVFGVNALVVLLLALIGSFSISLAGNGSGVRVGSILSIVLTGPLMGGLYLYFLKLIRGEPANMETVFSGFTTRFLQLFLGSLVATLLIGFGFMCLILPGIYLSIAWLFTLVLIIDKRLDFWPAMELSRKIITKHWWKFFEFAIVLFLLNLLGFMFCVIGFFFLGPIVHAAFLYAYEDIFGTTAEARAKAATPVPPPASSGSSGVRWGRVVGVGAAIVGIALIGIITLCVSVKAWHRGQNRRIYARAEENERRQADRAARLADEGWRLWQEQKLNDAADKFQQSVQINPNGTNAWNGLGWAKFNSGKSAEAENAFLKALDLDHDYAGSLNGLGQVYLSQGKYDEAENYLLQAAPEAQPAWYGLARLYLLQGNFEQAAKWAQDIVDSGQADGVVRQMLKEAQEKHLSEGLRMTIQPAALTGQPEVTNAIIHIRQFSAFHNSADIQYSAKLPGGYSMRATVNTTGPANTYLIGDRYSASWFRGGPRLLSPTKPGEMPPPPPKTDSIEQLQQQSAVLNAQLQELEDQGPVPIVFGEPKRMFSVTNGAGEVWQGFLEIVQTATNAPAQNSDRAPEPPRASPPSLAPPPPMLEMPLPPPSVLRPSRSLPRAQSAMPPPTPGTQNLSREEQIGLIEAQRRKFEQSGQPQNAQLLPPTPMMVDSITTHPSTVQPVPENSN